MGDNKKLYDNLLKSGKVTANELGDFNTFDSLLQDKTNATKLYNNLRKNDLFTVNELGDENTFLSLAQSTPTQKTIPVNGEQVTEEPIVEEKNKLSFVPQKNEVKNYMALFNKTPQQKTAEATDTSVEFVKQVEEAATKAETPTQKKYENYRKAKIFSGFKEKFPEYGREIDNIVNASASRNPTLQMQAASDFERIRSSVVNDPRYVDYNNQYVSDTVDAATESLLDDTKKIKEVVEKSTGGNWRQNIGYGFGKGVEEYFKGYTDLLTNINKDQRVKALNDKWEKITKGENVELTENEKLLTKALYDNFQQHKKLDPLIPTSYNLGKGAGMSAGFMAEFIATGAIARGVTTAGKTFLTAGRIGGALKPIELATLKLVETGIKTWEMPSLYLKAAQKVADGQSTGMAFVNSWNETYPEILTEYMFMGSSGKAANGIMNKIFERAGITFRTDSGVLGWIRNQAEEYAEEKMGEIYNAPRDHDSFKDFWESFTNAKENLTTLGTVVLLGGSMTAPSLIGNSVSKVRSEIKMNGLKKRLPEALRSDIDLIVGNQDLTNNEILKLIFESVDARIDDGTISSNYNKVSGDAVSYAIETLKNKVSQTVNKAKPEELFEKPKKEKAPKAQPKIEGKDEYSINGIRIEYASVVKTAIENADNLERINEIKVKKDDAELLALKEEKIKILTEEKRITDKWEIDIEKAGEDQSLIDKANADFKIGMAKLRGEKVEAPEVEVPKEEKVEPEVVEEKHAEEVVPESVAEKPVEEAVPETLIEQKVAEPVSEFKNKQLDIINKSNPMLDEIHTGIRSVDDIKTAQEAFQESIDNNENPTEDFTVNDIQNSLKAGKITVYSSYPIENGVFVTPSKMQAKSYSGTGKVYSKEVLLDDVAWIDSFEGQYAKVETVKEELPEKLPEKKTDISELQPVAKQEVPKSEQKKITVKEKKENIRSEFGNNSYEILKNYIDHSGEELIDYDRLINTTRNILKINPDDKVSAFAEALHYEMGYPDNWQDLRDAINKGGFERNRQAVERMIEVGVSLPKDISDLAEKYKEKPTEESKPIPKPEKKVKEPYEMTKDEYAPKEITINLTGTKPKPPEGEARFYGRSSLGSKTNSYIILDTPQNREWAKNNRYTIAKNQAPQSYNREYGHKEIIKQAKVEGKTIPENVKAEYPELFKEEKKPSEKPTAKPKKKKIIPETKEAKGKPKLQAEQINYPSFAKALGLTKTDLVSSLGKTARNGKINGVDVVIQQGDNANEAIIESIRTPWLFRGRGKATKALKQITSQADLMGITLKLRAVPEKGAKISQQQLQSWYEKNGFIFAEGSNKGVRTPNIRMQAEVSPIGFYSTVENALDKITQQKGTPEQFKAMLLKNGAKQAEMDWMDYDGTFTGKSVTKQDIQDWIDQNRIDVQEVTKGESEREDIRKQTKYSQYTTPGGQNYKELLLTMPENVNEVFNVGEAKDRPDLGKYVFLFRDGVKIQADTKEEAIKEYSKGDYARGKFKSSHWDEPNILAHIRFNERTTADGERVLFIEEIQSDWGQHIKKEGVYIPEIYHIPNAITENDIELRDDEVDSNVIVAYNKNTGEKISRYTKNNVSSAKRNAVEVYNHQLERVIDKPGQSGRHPNMPFKQTDQWVNLALRRMMRYATENGFDRIAWTTGDQQAKRYDLSKQIDAIRYDKSSNGTYELRADKDGREVLRQNGVKESELENIVGKEVAQKIINGEGKEPSDGNYHKTLSGVDLKVGGSGMKAFYDQIIPAQASKLGKPFGAKVETLDIPMTKEYEVAKNTEDIKNFSKSGYTFTWNGEPITKQRAYEIIEKGAQVEATPPQITEVQSISVTPQMKESVMKGVPLFKATSERFAPTPKKVFDTLLNKLFGTKLAKAIITDKARMLEKLNQYGIKKLEDLKKQAEAWHGTPYDFEKFKTEKIGTGEGAQAFGWGIYFTEIKDIAEYYAEALSKYQVEVNGMDVLEYFRIGVRYKIYDAVKRLVNNKSEINKESVLKEIEKDENEYKNAIKGNIDDISKDVLKSFDDAKFTIKNSRKITGKLSKNVYKVVIHKGKQPSEYNWLEWDKQVTELIDKKLKSIGIPTEHLGKPRLGREIYEGIAGQIGQKEASLKLLNAGIDGIKYPAESMSGKPTRGFNYVVFDENAITIEEKIKFMATTSGEVYGFTTPEGEIYIDPDKININTPIHEYGHLWIGWAKTQAKTLFDKGMKLADDKTNPYFQKIWNNPAYAKQRQQYEQGEKEAFIEEVLATAIGDKGEQFVNAKQKSDFKQWLIDLFEAIKKALGISQYSAEQLQDITFDEFSKAVAVELLKGEEIKARSNIDKATQLYYDLLDAEGASKKRSLAKQRRELIESDPRLKYIDDNIKEINSQLEKQGIIKKEGACP